MTAQPIKALENILTIACGGRPSSLQFDSATSKYTVSVFSDDESKCVTFSATASDLKSPGFKDGVIAAALRNLDGAMFPERENRLLSAFRSVCERAS